MFKTVAIWLGGEAILWHSDLAMMKPTHTAFLLTAVVIASCADDNGQVGEEGIPGVCEVVSRRVIGALDLAPNGIAPQDAIDLFLGFNDGTMNWAEAPSSNGTFAVVARPGPIEFVEVQFLEEKRPQTASTNASDCIDHIAIPVVLNVETSDGILSETMSSILEVRDIHSGTLRTFPETFSGTFSPENYVEPGFEYISTTLKATLLMSGSWLTLHVAIREPDSTNVTSVFIGQMSEATPL